MINLTNENKELCFADSTLKPLQILLFKRVIDDSLPTSGYWQYFTSIDEAIILESAEFSEGILEGNEFKLGSFVAPTMKVQWNNNGLKFKDMVCVPVQQIGNEYIAYFNGYVIDEEISNDGQTVSATLATAIYKTLDIKIFEGTNIETWGKQPLWFLLETGLGNADLILNTDRLIENFSVANLEITPNEDIAKMTLSDLLQQAGEILGAHIKIKCKRKYSNIEEIKNEEFLGLRDEVEFVRFENIAPFENGELQNLPEEYTKVEYIESTGEQYIDTGVIPQSNTGFEIEFVSNDERNNTDYGCIFGVGLSSQVSEYQLTTYSINDTFRGTFRYGTGNSLNGLFAVKHREKISFKNGEYSAPFGKINLSQDIIDGFVSPNLPITLFALNNNGDIKQYGKVKIYRFKIYEGQNVVRDFVPCIKKENSEIIVGLYDLVNSNFYTNNGSGKLLYGGTTEYYNYPYHINLISDKTKRLNYTDISFVAKEGLQLNYISYDPLKLEDKSSFYEVENNAFFELLGESDRWRVVEEVSQYIFGLDFYYCDLETVYAPFIEPQDFIVIASRNQSLLPKGYTALEYIDTEDTKAITDIKPNASNIEVNLDFEVYGNETTIFSSSGFFEFADIFDLYCFNNELESRIGYYDGSANWIAFRISPILKQQKTLLKINYNNGNIKYSGAYNGSGTAMTSSINTNTNLSIGGRGKCRLYHFDYYENGEKKLDLYPCKKDENGYIGLFDLVSKQFYTFVSLWEEVEQPYLNHKGADIVIPVLSSNSKGIHSMRANILSKATGMTTL